jgi:CRISPR-associated protein Cmr1
MSRPTPEQIYKDIKPPKADELKQTQDKNIIKQVRRYKLITPLFGGGVEAGITDDITPVSGKAIRGHLRFWWRATRGAGSLEEMKKKEEGIWGGASTKDNPCPSMVRIKIEDISEGELEQPFKGKGKANEKWKTLSYAAFPLGERDDLPSVRSDSENKELCFSLVISFPSGVQKEVMAALWAWETFGGIGGRTRRGFGSLKLIEFEENDVPGLVDRPQTINEVRKWIDANLKDFEVKGKWHDDVPRLSTKPSVTWLKVTQAKSQNTQKKGNNKPTQDNRDSPSPREVWEFLIRKLKDFRQARFDKNAFREGRGKIKKDLGISRWPEANEIRRRLNLPAKIVDSSTPSKFPRAQFGLPINFHLPHDAREPNVTLQRPQKDHQRRASPLILKPITCLDEKTVGFY